MLCFSSSRRWGRQKQWWDLLQFLHWTSMGWFWKRLHLWWSRTLFCIHKHIVLWKVKLCHAKLIIAFLQLLNRVFNIMREKNPDMVAGEKRKFVMKPPQVVRVGTKKTSFVNFTDICKLWVSYIIPTKSNSLSCHLYTNVIFKCLVPGCIVSLNISLLSCWLS